MFAAGVLIGMPVLAKSFQDFHDATPFWPTHEAVVDGLGGPIRKTFYFPHGKCRHPNG